MSDVLERFLRYVQVDSPSDPDNEEEVPSSPLEHGMARLLADASARQAVSATALAQLRAGAAKDPTIGEHPEIASFAPSTARDSTAPKAGSFNAEIAEAIVTQCKSL